MNDQKGEIRNYFGSIAFIFLFFLFISAFSDISEKSPNQASSFKFAFELSSNSSAVIEVQQYSYLKSFLPVVARLNLQLFDERLRNICGYNPIYQRIIALQKARLQIRPLVFQGFYSYYHSVDTDDFPFLS